MKKPKKIIVVDFGGIGDLVLAIPFLRGLKTIFPSSAVSILCAERTGMILKEQPYIDRLFLSPMTLLGFFKTGLQLRKKSFDMAINLMPETSYSFRYKDVSSLPLDQCRDSGWEGIPRERLFL